jgi:CubicO group peptidase (beta-lactamase class C family)
MCSALGLATLGFAQDSNSPRTFQALSDAQVFVLGSNGNLWLEQAPFGKIPPNPRFQIDGNVRTFQGLSATEAYVLQTDGKLWLEHAPWAPVGKVPPARVQVDGNVQAFIALSNNVVFVLGTDGKLWLEYAPFGNPVPPHRDPVDANVAAFQPVSASEVLVLGSDGKLWVEHAPFVNPVPPKREQVDGNVAGFQWLSAYEVLVLGTDGKLWMEHSPFGNLIPPRRDPVDANVAAFQAMAGSEVAVLGSDGKLWIEHAPFAYPLPPRREQVGGNVQAFQSFSDTEVLALGVDGKLWMEQGPFGSVFTPAPVQVDGNVALTDRQCDVQSCFSQARLSANISSALVNKVVGYVSIVGDLPAVSGGVARTLLNPPQTAMAPNLVMNIASVSKTLMAIGILKALAADGLTVDTKISPYIYRDWAQGQNISKLTFRHLLRHTSGFGQVGNLGGPLGPLGVNDCASGSDYGTLKTIVGGGVLAANIGVPAYGNCNFALLRELLPALLGRSITNLPDAQRAAASADIYIIYMNQNVFRPLGIPSNAETVACAPSQSGNILSYPFPAWEISGIDWGDSTLRCGPGGWVMSAEDVHKIINDLAQGNVLLTGAQKTEMFAGSAYEPGCLGWDCSVRPDCPDPYVCKNGGLLGNPTIGQGDFALFTYAGILKCNVPVVVYVNSFLPAPYQPWDTFGNPLPGNHSDIIGLVHDAYSGAVTISYPGTVSGAPGSACSAR